MTENTEKLIEEIQEWTHLLCSLCKHFIADYEADVKNCPKCGYPIVDSLIEHLNTMDLR